MDTNGFVKPVFAPAVDEPPYAPTGWNGKRMTWQEREIYFVYGAGIPDANGYWVREDGNGVLTPESSFVNINGKSRLALASASGSRYYWQLNVDGYTNPAEYYQPDGSAYAADNIQNPFSATIGWLPWGDSYRPVPSFAYGTEGYYFEETETTGLPIKINAPTVGSIYNSDATVRIAAMYPAK
jgi:hypothetical protein